MQLFLLKRPCKLKPRESLSKAIEEFLAWPGTPAAWSGCKSCLLKSPNNQVAGSFSRSRDFIYIIIVIIK
jgi:hypothetical protein